MEDNEPFFDPDFESVKPASSEPNRKKAKQVRSKKLQKKADSFLHLYDDMPSVPIYVTDHKYAIFTDEGHSTSWDGIYQCDCGSNVKTTDKGKIVVLKNAARIEELLKHELVHAWIHWRKAVGINHDKVSHSELFWRKSREVGLHDYHSEGFWKQHWYSILMFTMVVVASYFVPDYVNAKMPGIGMTLFNYFVIASALVIVITVIGSRRISTGERVVHPKQLFIGYGIFLLIFTLWGVLFIVRPRLMDHIRVFSWMSFPCIFFIVVWVYRKRRAVIPSLPFYQTFCYDCFFKHGLWTFLALAVINFVAAPYFRYDYEPGLLIALVPSLIIGALTAGVPPEGGLHGDDLLGILEE